MNLIYKNNERSLTLGVEMELQLIDADTLRLTPKAAEFLTAIKSDKLTKEMFKSTLEIITGVCNNVHEVIDDFNDTLVEVKKFAEINNIRFAGTGTNPVANYNNRLISSGDRYNELVDKNQWLIKRMAVYGLHVHIGMKSGEDCMRFNQFFLRFVPHLIAFSASSPFWRNVDTGLAASRPTMYEAHPTSGIPYLSKNWDDFERVYNSMKATGSINSIKDIWWDIRPSPAYGTIELRMCDGPATMMELESLVAFIHLLAHWFEENGESYFKEFAPIPDRWIIRENKWRAIRYGLDAEIIDPDSLEVKPIVETLLLWIEKLSPQIKKLRYEKQIENFMAVLKYGNSSARQRKVASNSNSLLELVEHNISEWELGKPIWN